MLSKIELGSCKQSISGAAQNADSGNVLCDVANEVLPPDNIIGGLFWEAICQAVCLSGCLAVWLSVYLAICLDGCLFRWLSVFLIVWKSGSLFNQAAGYLAI